VFSVKIPTEKEGKVAEIRYRYVERQLFYPIPTPVLTGSGSKGSFLLLTQKQKHLRL